MFSCDYTNNTIYTFDRELCNNCEKIKYSGCGNDGKVPCGDVGDKWVQLFIPEIKDIPIQKPDMEGIVSVNTGLDIISKRVIKTPVVTGYTNSNGTVILGEDIPNAECTTLTGRKLIIEGLLKQKVVYTALVEDQALHSATFVIPFSTFIIIDANTPLSQNYRVVPLIEDTFLCKLSERSLFSNTTLFIKASAVC